MGKDSRDTEQKRGDDTQISDLDRKLRSAQASVTALSIFIALSVAVVALTVSRHTVSFGFNATIISSASLMVAIILFLIAIEFFILCIYKCEHIDWFGFIGTCLYSFGVGFMVVGIAISMVAFQIRALSYIFLTIALLGNVSYHSLRMKKLKKEETYFCTRIAIRVACLLILVVGFILTWKVGG